MSNERLQLLIMDDEKSHIEAIRRAFAEAGGTVDIHAVGTLREYRERVAVHPPDIALVDLNLPDGRGVEVLSYPLEDAPFPALVMTAFGTQQIAVEVMKAGALDYVVKSPEVFADMPHTVERVLREWALLQRNKRVEAELRQSQKMESVGRLAGGVAHDFNNLLTAITCGSLMKELAADDPKRGDVKEILAAADRAASLTSQLLAFSRKQMLSPKIVNLNASVGGMVEMLTRLIGEDIRLKTRLAARSCQVKVDQGQMDQLIVNLAVNARDAMPKGGTLVLETAIVTPGKDFFSKYTELPRGPLVCLSISDTGIGMSEEVKEHLFEPFFTTKDKSKGTGLGLATVFGIVKQSGGEIEVESEPGRGTTFRIYLPHIEAGLIARDKDKDQGVVLKGTETVLLVEDEDNLRRLGERLLRMSGYKVIVAANGKEALEAVERHGKPVDLLLTNIVMSGMSGRELALELARRKLAHRTLYMSGYTDDAIVQHGVLEPGIAFIYKPFTIKALSLRLREVLDGPANQAGA
ncbi:MAG: response regulator [Elusimicrobiota bacterium]|nr:response regulator [Elusimicrobiota bacterium]